MEKLRIALLSGFMNYFSGEGIAQYERNQASLKDLSKEYDFDLCIYKELIDNIEKASNVRKEIDSKGIDFVLIFHPTYISGDIIFELMRAKVFLGLWASREPEKSGPLPLASLVCLNQNTSIASHYFKNNKKKFKWFLGNTQDKYFKPRFEVTMKVLKVLKELRNSRIAQLGRIAEGFRNMYYDEREIYNILGIDVVREIEIEDVLDEEEKVDKKAVEIEFEKVFKSFKKISISEDKILESIKMFLATKKICEEKNFKAVAFDCAAKPVKLKRIVACLSNSLLNSNGITAGCEGDMLSTISSHILRLISDMPTAVSDLAAFDDEDDSILLWHCGSAPFEMSDKCGVNCRCVYRSEFAEGTDFENLGPITDMIYRQSDVTVFRLTGESDYFYYFTGKFFKDNKESWFGSRGWVKDLYFYRNPIKAKDLINTILVNGIQHHYPFVLKNAGNYIEELAFWLDLKKVRRMDYEDFGYI